jgi:glycosyltransferase involved in cell wall biosynthesis
MTRKKILFQSDFSLSKTGFGRCMKALLTYLYKTGKYEIVHYSCGVSWSNPALQKTPWRSIGCLPDSQQELDALQRDPNQARNAGYGAYYLDRVIRQEKPDIYIGVQDFWGVDFALEKSWWNKIPSVIWTTLDSLPLLPAAVEKAPKIKNYWMWSSFATKELNRLGHAHVKTVHGALDDKQFCKLSKRQRLEIRQRFGLANDSFIIGFVFRNQLRKSVPNLIEGFKLFQTSNPKSNAKLLLHTSYTEGWDIPRFIREFGVDPNDVLTTYICHACSQFEIKPHTGEEQNCKFCGAQRSQFTTNVNRGVTENQLNEIYNVMDVYCHPFTSGGQEIPIQEAKLAELITLVTNYSCGEELCEEGSGSLVLDWSEYREHGTQFRKASTYPASIAKQLAKVLNMDFSKREELGRQAREWTIRNFSVGAIGKIFEEFIDSCETTAYSFEEKEIPKNPQAAIPEIKDDSQWLVALYKLILINDVDETDSGHKYWMEQIKKGMPRQQIEDYFRQVAVKHNTEQHNKVEFSDLLDKEDEGKRILYVIPESIGDVYLSTSLFESIKGLYPSYNLYVATKPEYFELLDGNPHVHKVIPYNQQMDNIFWLEGIGSHKGYFEIAFLPFIGTQRMIDYTHNGKDLVAFNIRSRNNLFFSGLCT